MFVKYRRANLQRLLFIDNTIMIEENNTIIGIGREIKQYSNEKTIAFDIAIINEENKAMVKRFVKSAFKFQNDNRRINYNFIIEKSLNYKPKLTFSHE
jgi:hypothetical protein